MENPYVVLSLGLPAYAWAVLQVVYFWPRMPKRIASHFNLRMEPDGWMGKSTFVAVYVLSLTVIGTIVVILRTPMLLPVLYFLPALFHLAFAFNATPGRERLSGLVWVLLAVFVLAMIGVSSLLR